MLFRIFSLLSIAATTLAVPACGIPAAKPSPTQNPIVVATTASYANTTWAFESAAPPAPTPSDEQDAPADVSEETPDDDNPQDTPDDDNPQETPDDDNPRDTPDDDNPQDTPDDSAPEATTPQAPSSTDIPVPTPPANATQSKWVCNCSLAE